MAETGLTCDGFLGGRVTAWQPKTGYRAATDPVLLAAACPAESGDTVLELGLGVGVASLCLAARVANIRIAGVERQADYAGLARRNAAENTAPLTVVEADITALPADMRQRQFDHVIANPPYYAKGHGTAARNSGREAALREDTAPPEWIATARARLVPRGWLTLIIGVERLPAYLGTLEHGFGTITVLPLAARAGRPAKRVILWARKGGRAPFSLRAPLILHDGARHGTDGDDFTATARAVLRDGAAIASGVS